MQQVIVHVQLGIHVLTGREIGFLEVVQSVGDHARCTLSFDRDPSYQLSPLASLQVADLADAELRVTFTAVDEEGAASKCLGFVGQVRSAEAAHQPTGAGRFTLVALSHSYELAEHVSQRYLPEHGLADVARALGVRVTGELPGGAPRDFVQPGSSAWGFLARLAAGEGLQLRPMWPRTPEAAALPGAGRAGTRIREGHAPIDMGTRPARAHDCAEADQPRCHRGLLRPGVQA